MTDPFRDLYEQLLTGIEEIEKKEPDPKKQIESSFHLSETFRRKAEEILAGTAFSSHAEKILFIKTVKPLFTSLVEFYSILYRAELFTPEVKSDQLEFWNYEVQRAQLFLTRNAPFFDYLKSGDTAQDKKYFSEDVSTEKALENDQLIARLLAREKYLDYINNTILPHINL